MAHSAAAGNVERTGLRNREARVAVTIRRIRSLDGHPSVWPQLLVQISACRNETN
jgi:hypothetical protein